VLNNVIVSARVGEHLSLVREASSALVALHYTSGTYGADYFINHSRER
jgi:hypothetical protein